MYIQFYSVNVMKYADGIKKGQKISKKDHKTIISILEYYKLPPHLVNIFIVLQSLDDAHKGLVFKGQDSKHRWQYYYGNKHVLNRYNSITSTLINVNKIWYSMKEEIDMMLSSEESKKKYVLGLCLYLLSVSYIRTGKTRHYKSTGNEGLLTLHTNSVSVKNNEVMISFIGKSYIKHSFKLNATQAIKNKFISHRKWNNNELFFSYITDTSIIRSLTEKDLHDFTHKYNIIPKDIRTYGSNIILLEQFIKSKQKGDKRILDAIEASAEIIGHTKSVSKKSYISGELIEYLKSVSESTTISNITASKLMDMFIMSR